MLYIAAPRNHLETVKTLLNSPILDVNAQDSILQSTILHVAGKKGFSEIVALLLAANADPNVCDQRGETLIFAASENGHSDGVELLLQVSADPNIVESVARQTALYAASYSGHTDVVNLLLRSGADPSIKSTSQGATLLHVAAQRNHLETVKALLNSPLVDVNAQDCTHHQNIALHVASLCGHWILSNVCSMLMLI